MNKSFNVSISEKVANFFIQEYTNGMNIRHVLELKKVALNLFISNPFLYVTLANESIEDKKYVEDFRKFLLKSGFEFEKTRLH